MREHGGNLDQAVQRFGGRMQDWIDLSTGINRQPYPIGEIEPHFWNALPSRSDLESLHEAARQAYATKAPILAMGGAQAAIQLLPRLAPCGRARAYSRRRTMNTPLSCRPPAGMLQKSPVLTRWRAPILLWPSIPTGDAMTRLSCSRSCRASVVSSSKALPTPGQSYRWRRRRDDPGLLILRSFGKFYGLAGLRLGFVLGAEEDIAALSAMAGPWPVSGAAIAVG
nr:aminotransferase class I/II-fold pyridoxal phosphate-dependent enzyme [Bradyrhizobium sp. 157]